MSLTQPQIALPERYRVLHRVATGGMATVYAATDEVLGRDVAIKVLAEALAADDAARRRFTREARAAARVSDHPHVVTIYDIGESDDEPPVAFIVMELLTGGTLSERLKSGAPIPHAVALGWLEQAALALDAAHAVGMVHRDVKPANLLLDAQGTLKVADFGIATIASEASLTQTGQVVGTAAYLSPEQALGHPATAASDRYALGVVAYELLTGRRPFTHDTPAAQALAHVEGQATPPSLVAPGLPDGVDRVLAAALAKEPADRPATAAELVSRLHGALGATATTGVAHPEPRFERTAPMVPRAPRPPARPARPPRSATAPRHSRLGAIAVAAAALLLAGIAVAALAGSGGTSLSAFGRGGGRHIAARTQARGSAQTTSTPATTPAAPTTTPAPASGAPADASAIERDAHAKLQAGDYNGAAGALGGLVNRCDVTITDPCAYAWYDLGLALLRGGRPDLAVPILEHRLQNPDQQGAVQATLDQARAAAAGGGGGGGREKSPKPGKGHGHFKGQGD